MLHCEDVLPELSAHLDRELPLWKAQFIRWHLRHCSACAEEAALLHQTHLLLRSVPDSSSPPGLMVRILSQAQQQDMLRSHRHKPRSHRHKPRWQQTWKQKVGRRILVPALAALLLLAVGMSLLRDSSSPQPPEEQDPRVVQVDLLFDRSGRGYIVSGW